MAAVARWHLVLRNYPISTKALARSHGLRTAKLSSLRQLYAGVQGRISAARVRVPRSHQILGPLACHWPITQWGRLVLHMGNNSAPSTTWCRLWTGAELELY